MADTLSSITEWYKFLADQQDKVFRNASATTSGMLQREIADRIGAELTKYAPAKENIPTEGAYNILWNKMANKLPAVGGSSGSNTTVDEALKNLIKSINSYKDKSDKEIIKHITVESDSDIKRKTSGTDQYTYTNIPDLLRNRADMPGSMQIPLISPEAQARIQGLAGMADAYSAMGSASGMNTGTISTATDKKLTSASKNLSDTWKQLATGRMPKGAENWTPEQWNAYLTYDKSEPSLSTLQSNSSIDNETSGEKIKIKYSGEEDKPATTREKTPDSFEDLSYADERGYIINNTTMRRNKRTMAIDQVNVPSGKEYEDGLGNKLIVRGQKAEFQGIDGKKQNLTSHAEINTMLDKFKMVATKNLSLDKGENTISASNIQDVLRWMELNDGIKYGMGKAVTKDQIKEKDAETAALNAVYDLITPSYKKLGNELELDPDIFMKADANNWDLTKTPIWKKEGKGKVSLHNLDYEHNMSQIFKRIINSLSGQTLKDIAMANGLGEIVNKVENKNITENTTTTIPDDILNKILRKPDALRAVIQKYHTTIGRTRR